MLRVLRAALFLGGLIDLSVAVLALFFQDLLGSLLDVPAKDPALATMLGGESLVVTGVYALAFRRPLRYAGLLWVCALDQGLAALLPGIEVARQHIVASWKTLGPIPVNVVLMLVYLGSAAAIKRDRQARVK
jgi:hypothetical protein